MLQTKWLVFLFMTSILLAFISGILEMEYMGLGSPAWNDLMSTYGEKSVTLGGLILHAVTHPIESTEAVWNIFTWNYAFFEGPWSTFRWVILFPISAAMAITFMVVMASIIRGGGG